MPKKITLQPGTMFDSNNHGKVEVIEYINTYKVLIKFINTGNTKHVRKHHLTTGNVRDTIVTVGSIFESLNSGKFEVIKYVSHPNIHIKFLDTGNIRTGIKHAAVTSGRVSDTANKPKAILEGETYISKFDGEYTIIKNNGCYDVEIEFLNTNNRQTVRASNIRNKLIRDRKLNDSSIRPVTLFKKHGGGKYLVYKHTNKTNGKYYIGFTSQTMSERWQNHINDARCKTKRSYPFQKAILKYGIDDWDHEILFESSDGNETLDMEREMIKKYNARDSDIGYNVAIGGRSDDV